ncbi:MAG: EAL domain-containing protein [Pseudomonadota bacterium]
MRRLPVQLLEDLARAKGIEQVLGITASWLPRLTGASYARITFVDEGRTLTRGFRRDGLPDTIDDHSSVGPGSPCQRALTSGQPISLFGHSLSGERDPSVRALYDQGYRNVQYVPMHVDADCVGVVCVAFFTDQPMKWQNVRRLTAAADWIAAQAQLMQKLRANTRMAETDPLTGLANRARLMRVLGRPERLGQVDHRGHVIGVLHVDLDRFKEVNDQYGHPAGDELLRKAGEAMRAAVSPSDLVARVGGDEFIIVTRSDPQGEAITALAKLVADRMALPMQIIGRRVCCTASIGLALAGPDDTSVERLISNADHALYEVKRQGRGGVCLFTEAMRRKVEARRSILRELTDAACNGNFEAFAQPVTHINSGRIDACELLARWRHPNRGLLSPEDFLEEAQQVGLSRDIDCIVRKAGLEFLAARKKLGEAAPVLSVNMSAASLTDPALPETLLWEVLGKGLTPSDLALEVKEADLTSDEGGAIEANIAFLAELGFAVMLDDFGVGHASMQQIRRLRISGLKLGRSLTDQATDPCTASILRAILAMAAELGLSVTAKGVGSADVLTALHRLGCANAQGQAIASPMDLETLGDYLSAHAQAPAIARAS